MNSPECHVASWTSSFPSWGKRVMRYSLIVGELRVSFMDQFISFMGKEGNSLLIDCRWVATVSVFTHSYNSLADIGGGGMQLYLELISARHETDTKIIGYVWTGWCVGQCLAHQNCGIWGKKGFVNNTSLPLWKMPLKGILNLSCLICLCCHNIIQEDNYLTSYIQKLLGDTDNNR